MERLTVGLERVGLLRLGLGRDIRIEVEGFETVLVDDETDLGIVLLLHGDGDFVEAVSVLRAEFEPIGADESGRASASATSLLRPAEALGVLHLVKARDESQHTVSVEGLDDRTELGTVFSHTVVLVVQTTGGILGEDAVLGGFLMGNPDTEVSGLTAVVVATLAEIRGHADAFDDALGFRVVEALADFHLDVATLAIDYWGLHLGHKRGQAKGEVEFGLDGHCRVVCFWFLGD